MSEIDAAPIPAGQFAPAVPVAAPLAPTSPPVTPNRSKDVIQGEIDALYAKSQQEPNVQKRAALNDRRLALFRELEGPNNKVHATLAPAPGEPQPEKEPQGHGLMLDPAPAGVEWDTGALTTLIAVGDAYGFTEAEQNGITQEFARSYQRRGMDPDARIAAAVTELEKVWGPEDGARFQVMLDRAEQELAHLHPTLVAQLKRVGGHWDAWSVKLLADLWQRRHPGT